MPPEWIDYNGHMNVAYYVLAFDHATDAFRIIWAWGRITAIADAARLFVVETHVNYQRELVAAIRCG